MYDSEAESYTPLLLHDRQTCCGICYPPNLDERFFLKSIGRGVPYANPSHAGGARDEHPPDNNFVMPC